MHVAAATDTKLRFVAGATRSRNGKHPAKLCDVRHELNQAAKRREAQRDDNREDSISLIGLLRAVRRWRSQAEPW